MTVCIYCRVSFDPQYFIQGNCIECSDEPIVRFKVKFDLYTTTTSVEIGCHMEETNEKFELKWARVNGIANPKDNWQDIKTKLDIVRPGRYACMPIIANFIFLLLNISQLTLILFLIEKLT